MTNDPLQPPVEINSLDTLQQAQYTASPAERHVAVISIPLWPQTWWVITIKLQWISCQRDSTWWVVFYISTFSANSGMWGFFFLLHGKQKKKLLPINSGDHHNHGEWSRSPRWNEWGVVWLSSLYGNARVTRVPLRTPRLHFSIRRWWCVTVSENCWNDLLAVYSNQQIFGEGLIESVTGEQGKLYRW